MLGFLPLVSEQRGDQAVIREAISGHVVYEGVADARAMRRAVGEWRWGVDALAGGVARIYRLFGSPLQWNVRE